MTSLKSRRRTANPMREFDRLPADLRSWLARAKLPWRAKSVQRAFDMALARTGDRAQALHELDRLQERLVARDSRVIWGAGYPGAASGSPEPAQTALNR